METIKERPILFNMEMVKAILDGRKTQTRRVAKIPENGRIKPGTVVHSNGVISICFDQSGCAEWKTLKCPHGKTGDRLWVRETWADLPELAPEKTLVYKTTDLKGWLEYETETIKWKPSIHMFRKYSRINLEITDIRVERVQDISSEDALAEGIERSAAAYSIEPYRNYEYHRMAPGHNKSIPECSFMTLWNSINAKPKSVMSGKKIVSYISYPWDDIRETREHRGLKWIVCGNPHVWAVTFKVLKKEV